MANALICAAVSLAAFAPFLRGAVAGRSFYFRDLSRHFFPLRLYALEGLRHGRLRYWNPYLHEGIPTAFPPLSYPLELLQLLRPDEAGLSLELALHVPLAALAFMLLARGLGVSAAGAAAGALVYALGGFTLSTLNLYVYLHAIAWAPLVVLSILRAARGNGRDVALCAVAVAVAVSTAGAEIVAQAIVAGLVLCGAPLRALVVRLGAAFALGLCLAAPTIVAMAGVLAASGRAAGFPSSVVLAHSIHPLTLPQVLVGNWHGDLSRLTDLWWGTNFFPRGFPYVLSLYLGATALALAVAGASGRHPLRRRVALLGAVALIVALGRWVGLQPLVDALGPLRKVRFPTKAFFSVELAVALLAAFGADAIATGCRRAAGRFAASAAFLGATLTGLLLVPRLFPQTTAWFLRGFLQPGASLPYQASVGGLIRLDAAEGGALALVAAGLALFVRSGRVRPLAGALLITGILCADLLRTGAALNPMVTQAFWDPSPEVAALVPQLAAGRVFTCEIQDSADYWRARQQRPHDHELWTLAAYVETLTPEANLRFALRSALSEDMTSLVPLAVTPAEGSSCGRLDGLLPALRAAGVAHVVSVDALAHPDLRLAATVAPARIAPLTIHVYELGGAAARVEAIPQGAAAVAVTRDEPGLLELTADAPAPARVVVREGVPAGWTATLDGTPTDLTAEASGRHLVITVPAGRTRIALRHSPPGLRTACLLSAAALVATCGLAWTSGRSVVAPAPDGVARVA
jgi:hypothetical protein